MAIGRTGLFRRLKDEANTRPSALIRQMRLERARELLGGHAGSVSEVAYAVGFNSLGGFSRAYLGTLRRGPLRTPARVNGGAHFSRCRRYRYALWRQWQAAGPMLMLIGLNPSTADAERNDPTIRRCIGFAHDWGFGGVWVLNLFAWRATLPADLKAAADPVGPRANRTPGR